MDTRMENTKPDVLQDGPLDQQRKDNDNVGDANNSLSSEASVVEDNRNEEVKFQRDKVHTDPPVFSPLKNFSSRPPTDSVTHPNVGKPLLLRPSVLSGSSAELGSAASKPDSGSFSSAFGVRPMAFSFATATKDQAGSARPFLLRPSKLTAPVSEQNDGTGKSAVTSSLFGAKPSISSDLSKEPAAGSSPNKPIFLRPSKLAVASPEKGSDLTAGNDSVGDESKTVASSESGSDVRDETNATKSAVLRPSQLAATTADLQISEKTAPPKNPFARVPAFSEDKEEKEEKGLGESGDSQCASETQVSSSTALPKFVRLTTGSSVVTPVVSVPPVVNPVVTVASAPPTFVFGQNLLDRVETKENNAATQQHLESNGANSSEMLFTSVIRKEDSNDGSNSEGAERPPSKSLSDAAREYEESRAAKRKYEEVAVVTGEEDEANVVQMNCKLYAFEKSKGTWVERGRGTLRLNDRESALGAQSRVVVRTAGNLRVVINTKVWAGMVVERASPKSVRLTAMDTTGEVKVFLVSGSQKETEQLYKSLVARVERQRAANAHAAPPARTDSDAPPANPEPKRVAQDADTGEPAATL
ncbi:ran-binding protein 3 [Schistocerca cancellata]|uniref:ran-binding protein 3 n=1 Tax=Schistocerca cancellata TaxID=274614 RepID=UPI002118CC08|nr:ran-binding protein 3 [Schistocerca cancellata]XP_049783693.1 ran-binding protein 3 [Schistocerca cancellata]XP_049783699.1 ran-binding protein 3 [Schistocerca cancellata]XP_049783708.1 ran-binding protein 3 [Schistocerca cancellata]XP_049783717.1 ran-binding protein 3 [Schistocerca cancellata]XP_049783726.1 ran-binding protein 3 [Schistocerca cancellata]XP_049783736.1 ran-binding protein 3 [Schistocerca cancellata]XP_049783744.1 ran-binding protein 3 [Schistocerca cancellata]XP_04978375